MAWMVFLSPKLEGWEIVNVVQDLRSLNMEEMGIIADKLGIPKYRAQQLFHWIFCKGVSNIDQMTNLPKSFRMSLKDNYYISNILVKDKQVASQDNTSKLLLQLEDGETIETVLMNYENRNYQRDRATVCISSQVGCKMGCVFCATGLSGWKRNLTVGEIIGQIMVAQSVSQIPVKNVVLMGMGEPLLNFDNVVKAVRLMNHEAGLDIGGRRITISTCGLVPQIIKLAEEGLSLVLAISLHGATDTVRGELMPINNKYPLKELIKACKFYVEKTGRRITFEYALMKNINSSVTDAEHLGRLLAAVNCNVNLIPINPVVEAGFIRPSVQEISRFKKVLEVMGVNVSIREEKGTDIDAACGQLRRRSLK